MHLATILRAFSELAVPISEGKKLGPMHKIEFLGVYLDPLEFQTSLPKKKINKIITVISNLLTSNQGTKWDLVSLLGHINFAMRITLGYSSRVLFHFPSPFAYILSPSSR